MKLYQHLLSFLLVVALTQVDAQTPTWLWGKCSGGNGLGEGNNIVADSIGNTYLTGYFNDTLIFGTDTLIYNNFNLDAVDAFIVKYDPSGNPLWAKCPSGSATSYGASIATDDSGNVYLTGSFEDSPTIQFDTVILTNSGYSDVFLVKYNSIGNLVWAKCFGGTNGDGASGVATDNSGDVYITGSFFSSTITFDTCTLIKSGMEDVFTVKLNSSGNVLWARNESSANYAAGRGIAVDEFNNVYICGNYFNSYIIFGNDTLDNLGYEDIFLVKYNSFGDVVWTKTANGTYRESVFDIKTNPFGKVIMTGYFDTASVTFPPFTLTSHSEYNTFIVQYDSSGNVDWASSSFAGKGIGQSIAIDKCGNINVAGSLLTPTITFDTVNLISPYFNLDNMFIIQLNSSGQPIWGTALKFGGDDYMSIAADEIGNIYLGGDFLISPIYIANDTLTRIGVEALLVAKLNIKCSVGIPEMEDKVNYILYPNPFVNGISVFLDDHEQSQITIYDILSRKCIQKSFSHNCNLNTESLENGIYIYKIINTNNNSLIGNGKILKE